tara:strand:- start:3639 stop:3827 length:189 start_codon:yes stop_codon:yes gene_type:complete
MFRLKEGEKRSVLIADERETNRDILNQMTTIPGSKPSWQPMGTRHWSGSEKGRSIPFCAMSR